MLFNDIDENTRHKIYESKISSKELGIELFNLFQNLETFSRRKNLGVFDLNKLVDLYESVNFVFCNYLKNNAINVKDTLNLYFYYLGFFIKKIKPFKLLLYYFIIFQ